VSRIKTKFITDNAVTNAKLAQIATQTFKGRTTASTGNVEDLTATQATAMLDVFTSSLKGLVPASGGGTTTFLRADGTFASPSAGAGDVVGPASSVNNNVVFFDGTTGKLIKDSGLTLSGSNTGDQTITLTSDVTGSGTGSFATTIAANVVTNGKFRQSAALSVVGNATNATANVADIVAASDFEILRRSGTAIGFGSINLASSNAVGSSILALANGGSNAALTAVNGGAVYSTASALAITAAGTSGQVLTSNGAAAPTWQAVPSAAPTIFGSRGTPRSVVAATGITSGASHMSTSALSQDIYVQGSITGNSVAATITAGTVDGQRMVIIGRNDTQTVTLNSTTTNVALNGPITMGAGDVIELRWDTTNWHEMNRA